MTNYAFLTITDTDDRGVHFFSIDEVSSYRAFCYDEEFIVKVVLKSGNEYLWNFDTMEEAKNSIKIIGDIRCQ